MKKILIGLIIGLIIGVGSIFALVQTSTVSFDVPTAQVSNINDAFDAAYPGRLDSEGNPIMSKANWTRKQLRMFVASHVRAFVKTRDARSANATASSTAHTAAQAIEDTP